MVYVAGPALSVCTLGDLLRSAGVVRGVELDINPAWVSGVYFHPTGAPHPAAFELFPDQEIGTQHYLRTSSRDFFSFDLRAVPVTRVTGPSPRQPPSRLDTAAAGPSAPHPLARSPPRTDHPAAVGTVMVGSGGWGGRCRLVGVGGTDIDPSRRSPSCGLASAAG